MKRLKGKVCLSLFLALALILASVPLYAQTERESADPAEAVTETAPLGGENEQETKTETEEETIEEEPVAEPTGEEDLLPVVAPTGWAGVYAIDPSDYSDVQHAGNWTEFLGFWNDSTTECIVLDDNIDMAYALPIKDKAIYSSDNKVMNSASGERHFTDGAAGVTFVADGVVFSGGGASGGIGITTGNANTAKFYNCQFINCVSSDPGGALALGSNKTVLLDNVTMSGNTTTQKGGAIYVNNNSSIEIQNSNITNNTAMTAGGGVYIQDGELVVQNGSSISKNETEASGGGIHASGGTVKISGKISENRASMGGGIYGSAANIVAESSAEFIGNVAEERGSAANFNGGAIKADWYSTVRINGASLHGNKAQENGGAIQAENSGLTVNGGDFRKNEAQLHGGAINVLGSEKLTVNDGSFIENKAIQNNGGAINTLYGVNFELTKGYFEKNSAGYRGGAIVSVGDSFDLKSTQNSDFVLTGNYAGYEGGGIYFGDHNNQSFDLHHMTITNNGAEYGGGVSVWNAKLEITGGVIQGNRAHFGGGVNSNGLFENNVATNSKLIIQDTLLENNHASGVGGGIYGWRCDVTASNATVRANSAQWYGGGVSVDQGAADIQSTAFINNSALEYHGGAVNSSFSDVRIDGGTLSGNKAENGNGGAVSTDDINCLWVKNATFTGNQASRGYQMASKHQSLYNAQIQTLGGVTSPYSYAYNNHDIIYSQYTVEFYVDGVLVGTQDGLDLGERITKPGDPNKVGHDFVNWRLSDGTVWNFNTGVTGDVKLYANFTPHTFRVNFVTGGGTPVNAYIGVAYGTTIGQPNTSRAGYELVEWRLGSENGTRWNFNTNRVTGDITLYAVWRETTVPGTYYTVSFNSNGGSPVDPLRVPAGTAVNQPNNPTRAGYTFQRWNLNGSAYDFSQPVNGNITLIAFWLDATGEPAPDTESGTDTTPGTTSVTRVSNNISSVFAGVEDNEPEPKAVVPVEESIGDDTTPLGRLRGDEWALLNLLLMIATAGASLVLLLLHFTGKKEGSEEDIKRRGTFRLLSLIPAIAAIVIFFLTEDLSNPMVMADSWTIVMAVIALVQVGCALLSRKKKEPKQAMN